MLEEIKIVNLEEATNNYSLVKVKEYLPYVLKRAIINNIKSICLAKDENGKINYDSMAKKVMLDYTFCVNYTNIDLPEAIFDTYDKLNSSGLMNYMKNKLGLIEEYNLLKNALNEEMDYELQFATINDFIGYQKENSMESQLKKFLEIAISKIPDEKTIKNLIKNVKKEFKNFDPQKLQFLNDKSKEFTGKEIPNSESIDKLVDGVLNLFEKKEK